MSARQGTNVLISPLLLRLGLAAVFLWAGISKVFYKDEFSGAQLETMARAGAFGAEAAPAVNTPKPGGVDRPSRDERPARDADAQTPVDGDGDAEGDPADDAGPENDAPAGEGGEAEPAVAPEAGGTGAPEGAALRDDGSPYRIIAASEIPAETVEARRYLGLTVPIQTAIDRGQWPSFLSSPRVVGALAMAAAGTELIAGAFLVFGFLTRLSALGLAGVMGGAIWLTQIGPVLHAAAQEGGEAAFLGFLPQPNLGDAASWVSSWEKLLFQFTLMIMSLALVFLGPGRASIDGVMMREKKQRLKSQED